MIDEYVHPWDHPPCDPDPDHPRVVTTPQQTLRGLEIGLATQEVLCTGCERLLTEGEPGVVYAHRAVDAPEWLVTRCYCRACAPGQLQTPTLGTSEVLVTVSFGVGSEAITQRHYLCLTDIDLVALSPPSEGTPP